MFLAEAAAGSPLKGAEVKRGNTEGGRIEVPRNDLRHRSRPPRGSSKGLRIQALRSLAAASPKRGIRG